jgi:hypothetical protein
MGSGGVASATLNLQKLPHCLVLLYYKIYKTRISETKTAFQFVNDAEWVGTRTSCNPITADLQLPVLINVWTAYASSTAAKTFGPSYREKKS